MDVLGRGYAPADDDCWSELRCYCCNNIQCGVGLSENFKIGWIVSNYYVKTLDKIDNDQLIFRYVDIRAGCV